MKPSSLTRILRMELPLWLVVPLLMLVLFMGMGGGYVGAGSTDTTTTCPESPEVCEEFSIFWDVWQLASDEFVIPEAVDPEQMTEGAINGMLDSLGDPGHTRYLSADAAKKWDESLTGEFEGIGAYLGMREGHATVIAPIKGSPAEAAGLQSGDVIIKVDNVETDGWTIDEVVAHVRGPKGTSVVLTIRRPEHPAPMDITVERDTIDVPSVDWTMLNDDVAFIALSTFSHGSSDEMLTAVQQAQAQGATRIIFDLRNNLGGFVHEAVAIAGLFLPQNSVVLVEEDRSDNRIPTRTNTPPIAPDIPMVVLVNQFTASSAEIVSGALQDAGRAELVGVGTVGTGTVLTTYELEEGAKLLLGTIQWLTPNGRSIHNQGIAPDEEVIMPIDVYPLSPLNAEDMTMEELQESEDEQLLRALELVQQPPQPASSDTFDSSLAN